MNPSLDALRIQTDFLEMIYLGGFQPYFSKCFQIIHSESLSNRDHIQQMFWWAGYNFILNKQNAKFFQVASY